MDEIKQRMFAIEAGHEEMGISISELKTQREEDRKLLKQMRDDLRAVKEIVTTWNNIKGFVQTVKAINSTIWFIAKIVAVLSAILMAFYLFGKTGQWTWPGDKP